MNIETISTGQSGSTRFSTLSPGAEQIQRNRESAAKDPASETSSGQEGKARQVQPEELLQSIKALTDNGSYSVRFEMRKDTNDLVINLIDQKSGEIIRQIPSDEILGLHKTLTELSGNLLQTES
ncbi:flagellar protein FlaG [uncultured Desulfobulbus sp.]|uniref:flagellar protein FlaG n=1 Tax=uncultured Desulfobulbus sp. TaxID=239745 RepID=UPI0029C9472E|nr:flagellar protein FlaG [uncultured Desulfobulbus sp.]